jgi:cell division protease FtsH
MAQELGPISWDDRSPNFLAQELQRSLALSEETNQKIDHHIQKFLKDAYDKAWRILQQNQSLLMKAAQLLLERETLSESELAPLFHEIQ